MTVTEKRQHPRHTDPYLVVRFGGGEYSSENWSFGGMLISGYSGDLSPGGLVSITGLGPAGGPVEDVRIQARVVRVDPAAGHLALNFLDIDQVAYAMLSRIYG
jgi:hypothetical protein